MPARLVLNLAGPGLGQFPFINLAKCLREFGLTTGVPYGALLNANGYPASAPSATLQANMSFASSTNYNDFVWAWDNKVGDVGTPAMQIDYGPPGFTVTEGAAFVFGSTAFQLTVTGTSGRVRFSFNGAPPSDIGVKFFTTMNPSGFSNMRIYRYDQEALFNAGQTWSPEFISQLRTERPKVLRFLDLGSANQPPLSRFSYFRPLGHMSWQSGIYPSGAWAGTISGTNAYTVGNAPDSNPAAYVDGEVVQGTITNANTSGAVTLNRNSLGAKAVIGWVFPSTMTNLQVGEIAVNQSATFTYNALLDSFIYVAGGLSIAAVPLDACIDLCNQLGADIWYPHPTFLDAAGHTSVTQRIRDTLNAGLSEFWEWGNEIWNFAFPNTTAADAIGRKYRFAVGSTESVNSLYGLRVRQLSDTVKAAWSPRDASQLQIVNGVQSPAGTDFNSDAYKFRGQSLASVRQGSATISIASPAVVNIAGAQLVNDNKVRFSTTGALPTGFLVATDYFVVNNNTVDGTANLAATLGGAAINTSGTQSGVHTGTYTNTVYQSLVGVDYNVAPNRPIEVSSIISPATYYQGVNAYPFDGDYDASNIIPLLSHTDDFVSGDPVRVASALAWLDSNIRFGPTGSQTLQDLSQNVYPIWNGYAITYGKRVANYEGGPQINAPSTGRLIAIGVNPAYSAQIASFFSTYKQSALFKQLVLDQFSQMYALSRSLYPAWYYFCAGFTSPWSTHDTDLYGIKFQSFTAISEWDSDPVPPVPPPSVPILSPPGNKILTIGGITGC